MPAPLSLRIARVTGAIAAFAVAIASVATVVRAGPVEDAKQLAKEKRWQPAAEAFRAAMKSYPDSKEAVVGFARAVADGRLAAFYEEAGDATTAWLEKNPDDRDVRLAEAAVFFARSTDETGYRAYAQEDYERLLKANPADEDAALGLARALDAGGDREKAVAAIDALLARKPGNAVALDAKGLLYYTAAKDGVQAGKPLAALRGEFEKAAAQFEAATKADPKRHESWMLLAHADHYLVSVDASREAAAEAAYLKALDVDPGNDEPLVGLSSLYAHKSDRYATMLARLAKEKPASPAVSFAWAAQLRAQGKFDKALDALRAHVAASPTPARGWFEIGEILRTEQKDEAGSRKAYLAALKADPEFRGSETAVGWLLYPLAERGRDAVGNVAAVKALQKEYEEVLALAPKSIDGHNNCAFFLREAYDQTGRRHKDILDACVTHYVAAAAAVPDFHANLIAAMPYPQRYGYAQVMNDTGLMFQYYADIVDLKKAEGFYRRAMEWTEHGYKDTYGNVKKILEQQGRWKELLDFAEACAAGLKTEDGRPFEAVRSICRADADAVRARLAGK